MRLVNINYMFEALTAVIICRLDKKAEYIKG